jgi:hypothetical protein
MASVHKRAGLDTTPGAMGARLGWSSDEMLIAFLLVVICVVLQRALRPLLVFWGLWPRTRQAAKAEKVRDATVTVAIAAASAAGVSSDYEHLNRAVLDFASRVVMSRETVVAAVDADDVPDDETICE